MNDNQETTEGVLNRLEESIKYEDESFSLHKDDLLGWIQILKKSLPERNSKGKIGLYRYEEDDDDSISALDIYNQLKGYSEEDLAKMESVYVRTENSDFPESRLASMVITDSTLGYLSIT